ncbi:PASTA domain-containing protein [Fulvivirga sp. 29W222]|uniref:PASTA domain-containing protein n=1 Tax=Fulvivirga marina TaxID=2494733 RepID=A0A937FYN5_9BACT|nr:PASTA domain-containing protein [Fulvivirga marina]MBL6446790.1 PASTA domain-containing protein [Fulvivirga marina]
MKLETDSFKSLLIHLIIVAAVLFGLALAFFYIYLPSTTNHGESITVPNLEGLHMEEIDEFLTKRNLRYEINDSTFSDKYPPLTILKQYPKPGSKVKEGRKIFISVNRVDPPTVPVPELVDRSLRNAESVLKSNELKRGKITYKPSQFLNLVLEMRYDNEIINSGERIPKGSTIDLIVGDGYAQSNFAAPRLTGNEIDDARFIILGSNLEIGLVTLEGDTTGLKSIVTKQKPEAGAQVRIGDAIDLWISPVSEEDENTAEN